MSKQAIVTRESLQALLNAATDDRRRSMIIGRALVALMERQTESERQSATTQHNNNVGFASSDAKAGTLTAKSFLRYPMLQTWQIEKWMRPDARTGFARICRYARQLNEIAIEKAKHKQLSLHA